MTENEWLACIDPVPMLEWVAGPTNERKVRLFLCACCARVLESAPQRHNVRRRGLDVCMRMLENALQAVEQYADGLCGTRVLDGARRFAQEAVYTPAYIDYGGESGLDFEAAAVEAAATELLEPESVIRAYRQAAEILHRGRRSPLSDGVPHDLRTEGPGESVLWLRDVIGNPFRPPVVDPRWQEWHDGAVKNLAQIIYDARGFENLPLLADTLEEAGCTDLTLLDHCRGPGPHIRGCWVVDLFIEAPRSFAMAATPRTAEASPPTPPPPSRPPLRPGDWLCPTCNAHNFARRATCLRCNRDRLAPLLREGDWLCPACKAHNFAARQSCHQCEEARAG